jgi:hypothetical protein
MTTQSSQYTMTRTVVGTSRLPTDQPHGSTHVQRLQQYSSLPARAKSWLRNAGSPLNGVTKSFFDCSRLRHVSEQYRRRAAKVQSQAFRAAHRLIRHRALHASSIERIFDCVAPSRPPHGRYFALMWLRTVFTNAVARSPQQDTRQAI